jgi:hypothetical protein
MDFHLKFSDQVLSDYRDLENDAGLEKRLKAVRKALAYLEKDLRHPSLHTHEYTSLTRTFGQKVFEAYAENQTSGAYRIFWCYGPESGEITILAITSHP